ncbi:4Fe-4S binding protein [bacterium]|nr:MAG: 4Fe-4S binding protein [bacterium]
MQKYRLISFLFVHILILLHVLWFKNSTVGSFDFQEFFDRFIGMGVLNAGSIMVIFAFFSTLIFGRFFCGWLCHFGAVQELAWWVFDKLGIKPKTINSRMITFLPLFILFNFYLIPNISKALNPDSNWQLSLNLSYPEVWAFLPGVVIGSLTFIVDGFLIVYVLGRKGFCRFVCPWGAFLKLPTSLSTFKVRKTGNCTNCNMCTSGCPTGIDVSHEINNYNKVINSNCTSCMICIDNCPEKALSYRFQNPINDYDNLNLIDFAYKKTSYVNNLIKEKFISLRDYDLFMVPFCIIFGLLLDGLFHIGHMLSFGFASIITLTIFNQNVSLFLRKNIFIFAMILMCFNGFLKYSQFKAINHFENQEFSKAVTYFEDIVFYYPIDIGKYHAYLGVCYLELNNIESSMKHYNLAKDIIPNNPNIIQLGKLLNRVHH